MNKRIRLLGLISAIAVSLAVSASASAAASMAQCQRAADTLINTPEWMTPIITAIANWMFANC